MATLVLNHNWVQPHVVVFYRNGCTSDSAYIQRDGYKRQINECVLFHFHDKPTDDYILKYIWSHHTTPEELYKFFGYDIHNLTKPITIDNVDPWICYTQDHNIVLYFGKDKPILKTKNSKIDTKHRKMWANNSNPNEPYKYWDVKNRSKLLFCSESSIDKVFPEFHWRLYQPFGHLCRINIGPFRASDPYDYNRNIIRK